MFASKIIGDAGYRVMEASTGYEGISRARQYMPDLVLLDVKLPDLNGLDVCRAMKSDPTLQGILVLLFSAVRTDPLDKALGLETGADGYLVKPVEKRELLAQVKAMLRLKKAEEKVASQKHWYQTILNSLSELVICLDLEMKVIWANRSALESIDSSLEDVSGQKCNSLWACTETGRSDCPVSRALVSGKMEKSQQKTGDGRVWDVRAYPVRDDKDQVVSMVEVAMDVTRNINTRKALERSEKLLKEVTSRMPGAVIQYRVLPRQKPELMYVSPGIFNLLALNSESIMIKPDLIWERVHPDDLNRIYRQFKQSMSDNLAFGSDFRVYGPGENIKWLRISTVPHEFENATAWYAMLTDITPLKIVEQELTRKALHDPLTGLPNRQLFNDRLDQAISYAQRYDQKVGLIFIDLDDFKPINDRYGHMFGDAVLQTVANRLAQCARKTDTVARFGGDEFVFVISSLTQKKDIERTLSKILGIMKMEFEVDGQDCFINASLGISIYPDDAQNIEDLIHAADLAMYRAKQQPGLNFLFYGDLPKGE